MGVAVGAPVGVGVAVGPAVGVGVGVAVGVPVQDPAFSHKPFLNASFDGFPSLASTMRTPRPSLAGIAESIQL